MADPFPSVPIPAELFGPQGPVEPGNEEFPIAFRHYARELAGTDDEVWTRYLQIRHGHRNMTRTEWRRAHHLLRHEPAHWHQG